MRGPRTPAAVSRADRELVERIIHLERAALREFFARFRVVLCREARFLRVPPELRDDLITQCLDDALMSFTRRKARIPRSVQSYVVTAFRNDAMNAMRNERQRARWNEAAVHEAPGRNEWIVPHTSSEHARRASAGPDLHESALAPQLERLASAVDEGLSQEERWILLWISNWVPQRDIAAWLGVSYGALRTRVFRLRERLHEAAARYAGQLSTEEERWLRRFFQRIGPASPLPPAPGDGSTRDTVPARYRSSRQQAGE